MNPHTQCSLKETVFNLTDLEVGQLIKQCTDRLIRTIMFFGAEEHAQVPTDIYCGVDHNVMNSNLTKVEFSSSFPTTVTRITHGDSVTPLHEDTKTDTWLRLSSSPVFFNVNGVHIEAIVCNTASPVDGTLYFDRFLFTCPQSCVISILMCLFLKIHTTISH